MTSTTIIHPHEETDCDGCGARLRVSDTVIDAEHSLIGRVYCSSACKDAHEEELEERRRIPGERELQRDEIKNGAVREYLE